MAYKWFCGLGIMLTAALFAAETAVSEPVKLPAIAMEQNKLAFALIDGYPDYKVVATHFRTDKNELRYILANPVAYRALAEGTLPLPQGSKIVKIGWDVKPMSLFPAALEANAIQRVEYMVKDAARFDHEGDHWGYARFVKKGEEYVSWQGDLNDCISCHSIAKEGDYVFTRMQKRFE